MEIKDKLLDLLNEKFSCEIDFDWFSIKPGSVDVVSHVNILKDAINWEQLTENHRYRFLRLKFNFSISVCNVIDLTCYKNLLGELECCDFKLKILYSLGSFFEFIKDYDLASAYFDQVLKTSETLYNGNNIINIIALYRVARISYIKGENQTALEKATELFILSKNEASKFGKDPIYLKSHRAIFLSLSLIIRNMIKLKSFNEIDDYLLEFIENHKDQKSKDLLYDFIFEHVATFEDNKTRLKFKPRSEATIEYIVNYNRRTIYCGREFEDAISLYFCGKLELLDSFFRSISYKTEFNNMLGKLFIILNKLEDADVKFKDKNTEIKAKIFHYYSDIYYNIENDTKKAIEYLESSLGLFKTLYEFHP